MESRNVDHLDQGLKNGRHISLEFEHTDPVTSWEIQIPSDASWITSNSGQC